MPITTMRMGAIEDSVARECRAWASGIVGRPLVEAVENERSQVTRLERAKPAHLPDDVERVLGVGLRKLIAGHGDSQPVFRSSGCKRYAESTAVVEPLPIKIAPGNPGLSGCELRASATLTIPFESMSEYWVGLESAAPTHQDEPRKSS